MLGSVQRGGQRLGTITIPERGEQVDRQGQLRAA